MVCMKMKKIKWKAALSVLLAAVMCFPPAANLQAANCTGEVGGYSATKISHPNKPVQTADGIVDYVGDGVVSGSDQGQGDRGQNYSWAAIEYGDYMYVATCYNAMGNTLTLMDSVLGNNFDPEEMTALLNVMYNGAFYTGEEDGGNPGGILIKVNVNTGEVTLLMSKATTGEQCLLRNACEYQGKLYFCGSVNSLPSIYQLDPETDEHTLVYQGMTMQDYYQGYLAGICTGIRGLCEFNGQLIVSCVTKEGPLILSSTHPWDGQEAFTQIASQEDLFNYPAYHYEDSIYGGSIWEMVDFNGSLYVSICTGTPDNMPDENTMQSFALVRGDQDESGAWTWTSVIGDQENDNAKYTFGIDPDRTRAGAGVLQVYGDYLYIGEYNDEEIALENVLFDIDFDFVNENLRQSVGLYRMDKNEDIELIVGDPTEMFPEGGISGLGSGFGRHENQYIWRMTEYDGKLFVGTFDTSSLLEPVGQFFNGDMENMTQEEWEQLIEFIRALLELQQHTGEIGPQSVAGVEEGDFEAARMKRLNDLYEEYTDAELAVLLMDAAEQAPDESEPVSISLEELLDIIEGVLTCGSYMSTATRGFDLYVTEDGVNFETITVDGFGDPYNHGLRVYAKTDAGLCIGTANPFYGTQLWKIEENNCPSAQFTDIDPDSWYHESVDYCIENGLMNGTSETTFSPDETMTRGQLVTILWRLEGSPEPSGPSPFTDLYQDWYMKAVAWAAENGVVQGISATEFNPEGAINRQDLAVILYRYTENVLMGDVSDRADLTGFPDYDQVADYAQDALAWANAAGLIQGAQEDDTILLYPQRSATRAEAAAVMMRFCENVK